MVTLGQLVYGSLVVIHTGIGSKQEGGSQPEGRARESRSCDSAQWEKGVPLSLEVGGEAQHLSSTHISIL